MPFEARKSKVYSIKGVLASGRRHLGRWSENGKYRSSKSSARTYAKMRVNTIVIVSRLIIILGNGSVKNLRTVYAECTTLPLPAELRSRKHTMNLAPYMLPRCATCCTDVVENRLTRGKVTKSYGSTNRVPP